MSALLTVADFSAFFVAVHGRKPFPWQARLAGHVCETGEWPAELDLPTGTGKTAVLDIAVFAMAFDAQRPAPERRMPRRAILVVDRRTVVDQAYVRARRLRDALAGPASGVVGQVADALALLRARPSLLNAAPRAAKPRPLAVAYLRGAVPRDDGWAQDPSQPLIGVSTVDQIGSRLLFRGYGVSPGMRSVHAGLLGNDIVYFLDEVHLSRPFAETLGQVAVLRTKAAPLPGSLKVVTMSATHVPGTADVAGDVAPKPFGLEADDRQDCVLKERLEVVKPLTVQVVKVAGDEGRRRGAFAAHLAELARKAISSEHRRIGIVVNRVDGALAVFEDLDKKRPEGAALTLITGRMRAIDRVDVEADALDAVKADARRGESDAVHIVVATQCIEAGADLDFDVLITECASLDALVQRFGRLDRLGAFKRGRGVVAVRSDQCEPNAPADPIYGVALRETWNWLESRGAAGGLDAGIGGGLRDGAPAEAYPLPRHAPHLLPAYLDLWSQTRPGPAIDPPVAPWLHGPDKTRAEVSIVWRADLDERAEQGGLADYERVLEVCPPLRSEALTIPLWAAISWLRGERVVSIGDMEVEAEPDAGDGGREPKPLRRALLWRGSDEELKVLVDPDELVAGDTLIVPSSVGGLLASNWSNTASGPVPDRGDEARLRQRHRLVVRVAALAGPPPGDGEVSADDPFRAWQLELQKVARRVRDVVFEEVDEELGDVMAALGEHLSRAPGPHAWLARVLATKNESRGKLRLAGAADVDRRATVPALIVELPGEVVPPLDPRQGDDLYLPDVDSEDDQASLTGTRITLVDHLAHVEDYAKAFTATYGLAPALARAVVQAAAWHDAGKADPRFQRWLLGGDDVALAALDQCLAKSDGRRVSARRRGDGRAGYPRGARHELLSVAMLERTAGAIAAEVDRDLVLHLIASHHGWCRPHAPVEDPGTSVDVEWHHQGHALVASSDHGLADAGATVVDRFWAMTRRYGWWGLAWLEALVRLADHSASRAEQKKRYSTGGVQP